LEMGTSGTAALRASQEAFGLCQQEKLHGTLSLRRSDTCSAELHEPENWALAFGDWRGAVALDRHPIQIGFLAYTE